MFRHRLVCWYKAHYRSSQVSYKQMHPEQYHYHHNYNYNYKYNYTPTNTIHTVHTVARMSIFTIPGVVEFVSKKTNSRPSSAAPSRLTSPASSQPASRRQSFLGSSSSSYLAVSASNTPTNNSNSSKTTPKVGAVLDYAGSRFPAFSNRSL
ncbi:hypothetical protein GQ42DRAFT_49499 [Ramicandelaber brevisporus]|nr:hypothetical protein GQ42DRAFT_49499 [Ramicandelaber brevisporus]